MITIDTIRSLSWQSNPRVTEGKGRCQITVEAHPNRHLGTHYLINLTSGGCSLARSPERALYYVRQRRNFAKQR